MLADANGLSGDDALVAGSTLTVPEVKTSLNDASTFKPYDPGEITGPTTPSLPYIPPPDKGCDAVQMMIMAVVTVVVSVYAPVLAGKMATWLGATAAAAGATATVGAGVTMAAHGIVAVAASAVARGIASAAGLASFSWKDVAYDGVTSALSAGLSGTLKGAGKVADTGLTYAYDAVNKVRVLNPLGRVIQGVGNYAGGVVANTVMGRDTNFSWSAVAATAVGSYVSAKLGGEVPGLKGGDITAVGLEGFGQNFVDGAVNASTRRLFGLGRQDWGQIGFQALSSTLANEVAQGLMQWQAEKANLASRVATAVAEGAIQSLKTAMPAQWPNAPGAQDWQAAAGGMGSGIESVRAQMTEESAHSQVSGESALTPIETGVDGFVANLKRQSPNAMKSFDKPIGYATDLGMSAIPPGDYFDVSSLRALIPEISGQEISLIPEWVRHRTSPGARLANTIEEINSFDFGTGRYSETSEPELRALDAGAYALQRRNVQRVGMAFLGPIFGGPAAATFTFGGDDSQVEAALTLGFMGLENVGGMKIVGPRLGQIGKPGPRTVFENIRPADPIRNTSTQTVDQIIRMKQTGRVNYVVTENGNFVLGRSGGNRQNGHIDLARGAPVVAAGEAKFVKGQLIEIDNRSGHYRPEGNSAAYEALKAFSNHGAVPVKGYFEKW